VAVLVGGTHDIDIIDNQIIDKEGTDIAGAFPREHFLAGVGAPLAPVIGLARPTAVTGIIQSRDKVNVRAGFG
jgi:hypothetical protein